MDDLLTWWRVALEEVERRVLAVGGDLTQARADMAILDLYRAALEAGDQAQWSGSEYARISALEDVIRIRARTYSSYPGYREEWRRS